LRTGRIFGLKRDEMVGRWKIIARGTSKLVLFAKHN
jgi:hypothetical protein